MKTAKSFVDDNSGLLFYNHFFDRYEVEMAKLVMQ
jgi:hypothetical protein